MLIRDRVRAGLYPFGMVSIRDGVPSGLYPFGMVSIRDCVHSELCPFGIVSIRDCVHSGSCFSGSYTGSHTHKQNSHWLCLCDCIKKKTNKLCKFQFGLYRFTFQMTLFCSALHSIMLRNKKIVEIYQLR